MDEILQRYLAAGHMTLSNLLLENYRNLGMNEVEFILLLQIMSKTQQGKAIDLNEISRNMKLDDSRLGNLLRGLLEKKILQLVPATDAAGRKYDKYDFSLLYDRLTMFEEKEVVQKVTTAKKVTKENVYQDIEVEFGRPLSPIELQTIDSWLNLDNYSPELILLALKEAVLNQVYNLKYIDKILISWEKQNIKTSADVQRNRQKRRLELEKKDTQQPTQKRNEKKPPIPMYDWSEES
ncbi:DnaD domain-containing protein [Ligilactobacillus apodemi]|uniref:DNA replication protein dnaD n=1 Tax=Ligilactobacillus apodemi DSM 16634 = JCM 16172 TaxID=1423724 RepID=A0A0R1TRS6_9LACO|nr:DnaD domain protein [Ligilactobacillus apodemi]KRL83913.1 DNA replication protein dnaD [Ligilactobacillus apodemi DSM 16634 = JCM 16172]MCR1900766.1 DnaD domain protein [Ligilactobacillus apodemi]